MNPRLENAFRFFACLLLAFSNTLAQKPELVVQTGHSDLISFVAFSSDGQILASSSYDKTIKLWEVATGRELRTLKGHAEQLTSIAFLPDKKTLASGSFDQTIKLWDVTTGLELRTLAGHSAPVKTIAVSNDGKVLASGSYDRTIKLWDTSSGQELRTLKGHSDLVFSVVFSPDGKTLVSGSQDKTVKLWDVATGKELRTLAGHTSSVDSVAFCPDGKIIASAQRYFNAQGQVKLWDVVTGRELRTLRGSGPVSFSPDGKSLAFDAGSEEQTAIILSDIATGQKLQSFRKGSYYSVPFIVFSPDGKTLAFNNDKTTLLLCDVVTGREVRSLVGRTHFADSVAFSRNGKTLASGNRDGTIKLWDLPTGQQLGVLKGYSGRPGPIAISRDSRLLAGRTEDAKIKLWDMATGVQIRLFEWHSQALNSYPTIAFSPDGRLLASGDGDGTIKLWDVATGRELRTLTGNSIPITCVAFSADSRTLAAGGADEAIPIGRPEQAIRLWDVTTGQVLLTLKGHANAVMSVAFSGDGKVLASGGFDGSVKLWDAATGRELHTLRGDAHLVPSVAFSPDNKTLASAGFYDGSIKLWEVASGRELHTLKGHANVVLSVDFNANGKILASGSMDTTIKLWDLGTGQELVTLISLDEQDWLVVTPDGLFDGSPNAWNDIFWRFNNDTFNYASLESFFSDFYYPGLLADIFAGKRPKAPADISQKDRRQPQLRLSLAGQEDSANEVNIRKLPIKIAVSKAPGGAKDVRLFRNGSLVAIWHGDVLHGQSAAELEVTVPIVAGENRLTAYVFNNDNVKSGDATLTVNGSDSLKRKGTAYVLAVGINQYANSGYNLKYAVADAEDFAKELKRQQTKLGNYERIEITSLNDKDATKANILRMLTNLPAKIQPEDVVVIYFAGHGTAQGNRFYLVPHDLRYTGNPKRLDQAGLQNILTHSISDEELERAIEGIDAGQLLLVIDACNSGQALEAQEKRRGPMNSKGLAQLAYEKGMYILTAAQSYQAALEAAKLGHGFLTYALVEEGLKTAAADFEPKDHQLLLREWLDYATNRVPQMQQETLDRSARGLGLKVVFLEGDEKIKDPSRRNLQRPRVFYRRETELTPFVVARP